MKIQYKKIMVMMALASVAVLLFLPLKSLEAASRDCDSNALIYCGALTVDELSSKLSKGTGRTYQSAAELQSLFVLNLHISSKGHYPFSPSES